MQEGMFQKIKRDFEYCWTENEILHNMTRQHYHDGYEIYLQISGERAVFFNDQAYVLKQGSMFIIEPFVLHMTKNTNELLCSRYLLNFNRNMLSMLLSNKEIDRFLSEFKSCIIQFDTEMCEVIIKHFKEIHYQWLRFVVDKEKRCEKLARMEIYRLLDKIAYFKKKTLDIINLKSLEIVSSPEIFNVLSYIEKHYAEEITLDDMVEYSHMSKSSFYRSFRKVTGTTFGEYLAMQRLTKAYKLVQETRLQFSDIAASTGFSSTAHMSRIFRQQYGQSPPYFRK